MEPDWKIVKSAEELLKESQRKNFPYFLRKDECYGLKIQVIEHVFSPKHFSGYKFFINNFPNFEDKKVLEIGSGHGVVSCYLATNGAMSVLATDINPHAVENTKINTELNNLKNIEVRESNVFTNIGEEEKFDIIFWNTPWAIVPKKFEEKMEPEDYGGFDPGYKSISRYISEGKNFLTKEGAIYLGYGVEGADEELIDDLIRKADLVKQIIKDDYFYPGERDKMGELIKFRMKFLKLTPKFKTSPR